MKSPRTHLMLIGIMATVLLLCLNSLCVLLPIETSSSISQQTSVSQSDGDQEEAPIEQETQVSAFALYHTSTITFTAVDWDLTIPIALDQIELGKVICSDEGQVLFAALIAYQRIIFHHFISSRAP